MPKKPHEEYPKNSFYFYLLHLVLARKSTQFGVHQVIKMGRTRDVIEILKCLLVIVAIYLEGKTYLLQARSVLFPKRLFYDLLCYVTAYVFLVIGCFFAVFFCVFFNNFELLGGLVILLKFFFRWFRLFLLGNLRVFVVKSLLGFVAFFLLNFMELWLWDF